MMMVMMMVVVMALGSEGRAGKDHQEQHGSEYFLHGTNLARFRRP
jgi:hypothetical protein